MSVPRTATSPHAWTMHRWVSDGQQADGSPRVSDALAVGWRNVAPSGSGLYTLTAMKDGQTISLTSGPVSGESALILSTSTAFRWCDQAAPPPGSITISDIGGGGTTGIIPPRPDPDLCVDPVTGVTYTYSWSTYATDHLGTVRAVVSDAPNNVTTVKRFDYEPFGVELVNPDNNGCTNTHKYTGHERDSETGNDYMHFRYFSASMGRFQKPDSVFQNAAANPQGFNLYSYVSGNPVNFNDPTGHMKFTGGDFNLWAGRATFLGIDVYAEGGGGGGGIQLDITHGSSGSNGSGSSNTGNGQQVAQVNVLGALSEGLAAEPAGGEPNLPPDWYIDPDGNVRDGEGNIVQESATTTAPSQGMSREDASTAAAIARAGVSMFNAAMGLGPVINMPLAPFSIYGYLTSPLSANPTKLSSWARTIASVVNGTGTFYGATGAFSFSLPVLGQVLAAGTLGYAVGDIINTFFLSDDMKKEVGYAVVGTLYGAPPIMAGTVGYLRVEAGRVF